MTLDLTLWAIAVPTVVTIATLIFSFGMFYQKVKSMDASLKILNHNSTLLVKVLLRRGLIEPDDVKGV